MNPYLAPTAEPEPDLTRPDFCSIGHGARGVAIFGSAGQLLSGWMLAHVGASASPSKWGWFLFLSGIVGLFAHLMEPLTFRRKLRREPLARSGEATGAGMVSRITDSGWVQGVLFLTPAELVFVPKSKALFGSQQEERYPLSAIVVRLRREGYFLSPKLSFESGGQTIRFSMGRSRAWQKAIWKAAAFAGLRNFF